MVYAPKDIVELKAVTDSADAAIWWETSQSSASKVLSGSREARSGMESIGSLSTALLRHSLRAQPHSTVLVVNA